jgi:superfamily II DNA or RNA helicase
LSTEDWRAMLAEHQRLAAARATELLARRGGLILADEVGLGKSYVAAAVASSFDGDVELIVPASLTAQWRATLDQFEVNARMLTHDSIAHDPFVADATRSRLVIVDEAHAFRNARTQRYDALARRSAGARLLLVTATPVCNSIADLEALLALIVDDDSLQDRGVPSLDLAFQRRDRAAIETIVAELVIRRHRDVLSPELRFGELERKLVRHRVFPATAIDGLAFPLTGGAALLRRFLWRRLESSEAALLESIRRQLRFYDRALDCLAAGRTLTKRDYRRAFGHEEDRDAFQQVLFWDLWAPPGEVVAANAVRAEVERLCALRSTVEQSPCEKRQTLVEIVRAAEDAMLIFTGSAATALDLFETLRLLRRTGLVTARQRRRDATIAAFRAGAFEVLICTDLAAEGLNLQRAGTVVHYDIPWNPVKLDQRNGRAHRIGQRRASVRAIYFLPEEDATGIVATVATKNRVRRRVLRAASPAAEPCASTLRPRVTRDAAVVRFFAALERNDLGTPEILARRHRAGIERLLEAMSREFLDEKRVNELLALVSGAG